METAQQLFKDSYSLPVIKIEPNDSEEEKNDLDRATSDNSQADIELLDVGAGIFCIF